MDKQEFIKYSVIIIAVLLMAFLSQQAYYWKNNKTIISGATNRAVASLGQGYNWVTSKIYPKVTGEVQKRGEIIKTEVIQEKQKISENIGTQIKNYFSGIANSVLHPGTSQTQTQQNCQPTQTSSQTSK